VIRSGWFFKDILLTLPVRIEDLVYHTQCLAQEITYFFLSSQGIKMPINNDINPIFANEVPIRQIASIYPDIFAKRMNGRTKRALGDHFGLSNFGVNLTRLNSGAQSALQHVHTKQDEFVYILEGRLTLIVDAEEYMLQAGMCFGFKAGTCSHMLINRSPSDAVFLEIGDRSPDDRASYPNDDLLAERKDGSWVFSHRDGTLYK
jgi:uncharacterized cupin superfamily protein